MGCVGVKTVIIAARSPLEVVTYHWCVTGDAKEKKTKAFKCIHAGGDAQSAFFAGDSVKFHGAPGGRPSESSSDCSVASTASRSRIRPMSTAPLVDTPQLRGATSHLLCTGATCASGQPSQSTGTYLLVRTEQTTHHRLQNPTGWPLHRLCIAQPRQLLLQYAANATLREAGRLC